MNGFYNTTYTYHVTTNGVVIPLRMNGFYNTLSTLLEIANKVVIPLRMNGFYNTLRTNVLPSPCVEAAEYLYMLYSSFPKPCNIRCKGRYTPCLSHISFHFPQENLG